jgi:hypothetical protein
MANMLHGSACTTPRILNDIMGSLRESIPKLTRSSLYRCLLRHGISQLPASKLIPITSLRDHTSPKPFAGATRARCH